MPSPQQPRLPAQRDTLTETIEALRDAGFTEDFRVDTDGISTTGHTPRNAAPEAFSVIGRYRYEGASNPDDEAIVLALVHDVSGLAGTLVTAFGPTASAAEADVLTRLPAAMPNP